MRARANILGHSIHQMLIVLPLGLLVMSFIFDLIGGTTHHGTWNFVAFYIIGAGIISGLVAAVFGLIDWLGIPSGTVARSVGLRHAVSNVVAIVLFAISWWMRRNHPEIPGQTAILFSALGVVAGGLGGWFGGELVDRHAVGVDEGAHVNSPSSLSRRPAGDNRV